MKKFSKVLIAAVLAVFLMVGSSWAVAITDPALQNFFDDPDQNWGLDANTDQVDNDYFTLATASGGSHMMLYRDTEDYAFGIYDGSGNYAEVFDQGDTSVASAVVYFENNGAAVVQLKDDDGRVNIETTFDFNGSTFGFYFADGAYVDYINDITNSIIHTDETLNYNGEEKLLCYDAGNGSFVFAGELGGDNNYFDMVTQAESLQPVPEPATILLLGGGLLGLAGISRKKILKS